MALGVGVALLMSASAGLADDDARRMRRLLASGYWPREMSLSLGAGGGEAQTPAKLDRNSTAGGDARHAASASGGAGATGTPAGAARATGPAKVTEAKARGEIARIEKLVAQNQKATLELDRAGMDYTRMTAGQRKKTRTSLRPLLLYLVEQGVIEAGEVDRFMESEDAVELMARVQLRLGSLGARRTILEMERLFLVEQLPKGP